jgi:hypothetical protein
VGGSLNYTGSRPLVLTPIPNQYGSANITVIATDGALRTTNTFVLVVNPVADTPIAGTAGALNLTGVDGYVAAHARPGDSDLRRFHGGSVGLLESRHHRRNREILSQGTGGNAFYIGMA